MKRKFSGQFWLVVLFEFFERGSYYGMMSILSVYFTDHLFFPKEHVGIIKSTIQPILYFLPIVAGALADRFGYRKTLLVAFSFLGMGYFLTSQVQSYTLVFLALVVMAMGAGAFKPIISSSIARLTTQETSTLGFGIYYWSINLGAFLFPLILVPLIKNHIGWHAVMIASAIGTGSMIIPTLLFYREPPKPKESTQGNLWETLSEAFAIIYSPFILIFKKWHLLSLIIALIFLILSLKASFFFLYLAFLFLVSLLILKSRDSQWINPLSGMGVSLLVILTFCWWMPGLSVFTRIVTTIIALTLLSLWKINIQEEKTFRDHLRFLMMIFLYSGFWVLYFQMFDAVLWYVNDYVDATPLNQGVNAFFQKLGISLHWQFDVEHVTVINAGTIILLQLFVSQIVKKKKALPTMVTGIFLGTLGMAILAISPSIWVFMAGIIIFSIGEMTAHPKFIAYIGETAPRDKVATYMGYIFLYGVIGSSIGGILGAQMYVHFVDKLHQPRTLWLLFSLMGVFTIGALLVYNALVLKKHEA